MDRKNKKNFIETIASVVMSNIPGRGLSNYLFQKIQYLTSKNDMEVFSEELKERIGKIDSINQFDLVNLGVALFVAFETERDFKKGWIVDAYWAVYNKCNTANKTVLTSVSGW